VGNTTLINGNEECVALGQMTEGGWYRCHKSIFGKYFSLIQTKE
jgi:hypothetical protein